MQPLHEILDTYNFKILKAILKAINVKPGDNYKRTAIQTLVQALPEEKRVQLALADLDHTALTLLAYINASSADSVITHRVKHKMVLTGAVKPTPTQRRLYEGKADYRKNPCFEDVHAKLLKYGLVLSEGIVDITSSVLGWLPGRRLFLPDYVKAQLHTIDLPELPDPSFFEPTFVLTGSVITAQRDIGNYLRFVERVDSIAITNQGHMYKTNFKALAGELSRPMETSSGKNETDNGYAFFLRRLLTERGALLDNYGSISVGPKTHPYWTMSTAERIQWLFSAWADTTAWNGLRFVPSYAHGVDIRDSAEPALFAGRHIILDMIRSLGTNWVSLSSLREKMQDEQYGFLMPQRSFDRSYYYSYGYGTTSSYNTPYIQNHNVFNMGFADIKDEAAGWDLVEGAYINHIIAGPLYWLGVVDLGYPNAPKTDLMGTQLVGGYRLTDWGRWLLGMGDKPEVKEQGGGIILQPNFEVLAMQPVPVEVLMTLDIFAQVKDSQQHVTTYEISRDTIYRAQQSSWSVPEIIGFFKKHSRMPVPDNVRRSLEEWDALFNRITIRRKVRLAEVTDGPTASELASQLTDTIHLDKRILISDLPWSSFVNEVRAAGYLPLQTRKRNTDPDNCISIDNEGRIRYLHKVPSIYAASHLSDISIEVDPQYEEGAQRRILPAMLQSQARTPDQFNQLVRRLERLNRGSLSAELTNKLRAWGHYFGGAQAGTLQLIEFRDHRALTELLEDSVLKSYLTEFNAGGRALAVVDPDHADLVRQRLAELGVVIRDDLTR